MGQGTRRSRRRNQRTHKRRQRGAGPSSLRLPSLARTLTTRPFSSTSSLRKINVSQFADATAKIPESTLALMTATELKKLLGDHGETINPTAKREELYKQARRAVKDKLIQNENEQTLKTNFTQNTTFENASAPSSIVKGESGELFHETFGSPATIVEITTSINPTTASELELKGIPDNALGLFEKAKQDLHEAIVMRPLLKSFKLTPQNKQRISLYSTPVERSLMEAYEGAIQKTLKVILANSTRADIKQIQTLFTPDRLVRFKASLLYIFSKSPEYANKIFDTLVWDILTRPTIPPEVIDSIITRMQTAPFKTLDLIQSLSVEYIASTSRLREQEVIAGFRGFNTFRARVLSTMVLAGLGGIAYFIIFSYASSPTGFVWYINNNILYDPTNPIKTDFRIEYELFKDAVSKYISEGSIGETLKPVGEQVKASYKSFTESVRPKSFFNRLSSIFSSKPTNAGELR
jgi:hypothetical protein